MNNPYGYLNNFSGDWKKEREERDRQIKLRQYDKERKILNVSIFNDAIQLKAVLILLEAIYELVGALKGDSKKRVNEIKILDELRELREELLKDYFLWEKQFNSEYFENIRKQKTKNINE